MITAGRVRAARAFLGLDQSRSDRIGLSLPTLQRVDASNGIIGGSVDSPMKPANALSAFGSELIGNIAHSTTGSRETFFVS
jgi:hypothetical protein